MNRSIVLLAIALLALPFAATAQRRGSEFGDTRLRVIEDPLRVTFMGDPQKITREQVQKAVETAALAKDWKVLNASDGRIELTTLKNGKHMLHVVVAYSDAGCVINYIESTNLMYKELRDRARPVRVIHRNYNVWVRELSDAITGQLGQPAKVGAVAAAAPARAPVKLAHNRIVPPASGYAAIGDVDKVPVREAGKDRYRAFLTMQAPKAFVVMEGGGWRLYSKDPDAMAMALDHCEQVKVGCWLYAVDDRVVFTAEPEKRISRVSQLERASP